MNGSSEDTDNKYWMGLEFFYLTSVSSVGSLRSHLPFIIPTELIYRNYSPIQVLAR